MLRLFSIGDTMEGPFLWTLKASSKPGIEEAKPSFKYVANMHGNEASGRSACQSKSNSAKYCTYASIYESGSIDRTGVHTCIHDCWLFFGDARSSAQANSLTGFRV